MRPRTNEEFKQDLVNWLVAKLTTEPESATDIFESILKLELWKLAGSSIQFGFEPTWEIRLAFQSHWLTSGHHIRKQILDDRRTANLLKHMMPAYGGSEKTLYRGENKWNWDNGQIGFCWTDKLQVAKNFAGGLHNDEFGAVIQIENTIRK